MKSIPLLLALLLAAPAAARAQIQAQAQPLGVLAEVGIDQEPGAMLPLDAAFRDESGRQVRLGDLLDGKPVLLSLIYFDCPMLCSLVLDGLVRSLRPLALTPGEDFTLLTVSFDPEDTVEDALARREHYVKRYGREVTDRGAWHFLTGDPEPIRRLTEAVGFRYREDPETGEYAHPAALIVVTPEGKVARYLLGAEPSTRDIRLAVVEASEGKVGSPVDQVLLYCYRYDPLTGEYGLAIMNALRVGGLITIVGAISLVAIISRRRRRNGTAEASP